MLRRLLETTLPTAGQPSVAVDRYLQRRRFQITAARAETLATFASCIRASSIRGGTDCLTVRVGGHGPEVFVKELTTCRAPQPVY